MPFDADYKPNLQKCSKLCENVQYNCQQYNTKSHFKQSLKKYRALSAETSNLKSDEFKILDSKGRPPPSRPGATNLLWDHKSLPNTGSNRFWCLYRQLESAGIDHGTLQNACVSSKRAMAGLSKESKGNTDFRGISRQVCGINLVCNYFVHLCAKLGAHNSRIFEIIATTVAATSFSTVSWIFTTTDSMAI